MGAPNGIRRAQSYLILKINLSVLVGKPQQIIGGNVEKTA